MMNGQEIQALYNLYPNVVYTNNDIAYDIEDKQVVYDIVAVKARAALQAYKYQRAPEYPSLGDQLDDLFHSGAFSDEMRAKIQAVKTKYPKS